MTCLEKITSNKLKKLVEEVLRQPDRTATFFADEKTTVKATYVGKKRARSRTDSVLLTFGSPNYRERIYIKIFKKASEPFPVRKIYLPKKAK